MKKTLDSHGHTIVTLLLAFLVIALAVIAALRVQHASSNTSNSNMASANSKSGKPDNTYGTSPCIISTHACFAAPARWASDSGAEQYTLDHSLFSPDNTFTLEWTAETKTLGKDGYNYVYDIYGDYGQVDVYTTLTTIKSLTKVKDTYVVQVVDRYIEPVDTYTGEKNKQVYRPVAYIQSKNLFAASGLVEDQEVKLQSPQNHTFSVQTSFNKRDSGALLMAGYPKYDSVAAAKATFDSQDGMAGYKALLSLR